jgi:thioredoxin 1
MLLRDGVLLFNQAGMLPAAAIDNLVQQAEAIDMDKVREEMAAAR